MAYRDHRGVRPSSVAAKSPLLHLNLTVPRAALRLLCKLLKKQGFAPTLLTTDKLGSYGSAFRHHFVNDLYRFLTVLRVSQITTTKLSVIDLLDIHWAESIHCQLLPMHRSTSAISSRGRIGFSHTSWRSAFSGGIWKA
jgi:hypothetical protein